VRVKASGDCARTAHVLAADSVFGFTGSEERQQRRLVLFIELEPAQILGMRPLVAGNTRQRLAAINGAIQPLEFGCLCGRQSNQDPVTGCVQLIAVVIVEHFRN